MKINLGLGSNVLQDGLGEIKKLRSVQRKYGINKLCPNDSPKHRMTTILLVTLTFPVP
jgi:hypothetical protein